MRAGTAAWATTDLSAPPALQHRALQACAWKAFLFLDALLLHRPARGGQGSAGKRAAARAREVAARLDLAERGAWPELWQRFRQNTAWAPARKPSSITAGKDVQELC